MFWHSRAPSLLFGLFPACMAFVLYPLLYSIVEMTTMNDICKLATMLFSNLLGAKGCDNFPNVSQPSS